MAYNLKLADRLRAYLADVPRLCICALRKKKCSGELPLWSTEIVRQRGRNDGSF